MFAQLYELSPTVIFWAALSCLLTFAVFGSLFVFWEQYLLDTRRQNEAVFTCARESRMMDQLVNVARKVKALEMPASHGIDHARMVFYHAICALEAYSDQPDANKITMTDMFAVLAAALLHDVDDRKYFPGNKNFENARAIMLDALIDNEIQDAIIRMIGYVSCSKNRNAGKKTKLPWVPDEAKMSPWVLIPRHGDRLEAMGYIGIVRAWEYTAEIGGRLANIATLRATTKEELAKIAVPERYEIYLTRGRSGSMMDHYYDKLLHLHKEPTHNVYLDHVKIKRLEPLIAFCLRFGCTNKIKQSRLESARKSAAVEARAVRTRVKWISPMSKSMRKAIEVIMKM